MAEAEGDSGPRRRVLALDDGVLLERCQKGDTAAFGPLVMKYQDRVFNAIMRMCGNYQDAEELCQDTFVKALENVARFRQASGFYTWLFRIAVNLTISRRRRAGRVKFRSVDSPAAAEDADGGFRDEPADERHQDPQEAVVDADVNRRVLKALEELDEEFRVAVVLRDMEGMDYEQISQVLNVPVGTVKSRLYRARGILHGKLRDLVP